MDISKLGTKTWSEPGRVPQSKDAVSGFRNDIEGGKITNSIGDLLQLSRTRSNRQFMQSSSSTGVLPVGGKSGDHVRHAGPPAQILQKPKQPPAVGNVMERPATRMEIEALNAELQERIRVVLDSSAERHSERGITGYDPHQDAVALIRDRVINEFNTTVNRLTAEPWLEDLIKCECLRQICDETALKLTDMLSVTSAEFGNVLRKLRNTFKQSHEQMRSSWAKLRERHVDTCNSLMNANETVEKLEASLRQNEQDIRSRIDAEVFEMRDSYERERAKDREHVLKTEQQMAEMAITLRDLNALFKTMQGDADAAIASDTMARCRRLEKEVQDLEQTVSVLAKTKEELHQEQKHNRQLEATIKNLKNDVDTLESTVSRQDETIANLMGREAMHHAEIDKLKKMAAEKAEKEEDLEFDQTSTALLCIKCKKALDDLSNIRDAVLGSVKPTEKLMCQNFRILLPNLKGRRPSRDSNWIRKCMRAILLSKMREICALMPFGIAGQVTGFPEFVYAWFDPVFLPTAGALTVGGASTSKGSAASVAQLKADEDRWGFYYGVKAMSRENMEAKLVWSLLDEAQGEDGLAFVMNCLSIALSLGGNELWRQFGDTSGCDSVNGLYFSGNSNVSNVDSISGEPAVSAKNVPTTIWLRVTVAKQAAKLILVKALEPQLHATMDAIEALKETPDIESPLLLEEEEEGCETEKQDEGKRRNLVPIGPEPTHIDIFVWLRILLQRLQEEQSHRSAAIRLMFDTSSVGALTAVPPQATGGNSTTVTDYIGGAVSGDESMVLASLGATGAGGESHVEFPQFSAILKTLYPSMPVTEIASLFGTCYEMGLRKVTANVFFQVAESHKLFSRSMRFTTLPLLRRKPDETGAEVMPVSPGETIAAVSKSSNETVLSNPAAEIDTAVQRNMMARGSRISPARITPETEQKVRKSLGAFVHSRAKMIEPEVHRMASVLPERWRMVLTETYLDLNNAISDNFAKIRTAQRAKNMADRNSLATGGFFKGSVVDKSSPNSDKDKNFQFHIDGLQPYLYYRKLLSLMLLFESLCDNPLLPGDLLSSPSASSAAARRGLGTAANVHVDCLSFHNARSIVLNIENAILGQRFKKSKISRFENLRRSISARRIQYAYTRIATNRDLAVPLVLRNVMQSGYLTHRGSGPPAEGFSNGGLRVRKIYMEPWCAQAAVAEIFYFKMLYDRKAQICSLPSLSLKVAVSASHLQLWGCPELAELAIHDLCCAVKSYMHGLPRLRLFAAFLGFSDLDQPIAGALTTPVALSCYLQLVVMIHSEVRIAEMDEGKPAPEIILFPCVENPMLRPDKRDFWKCDPDILLPAVQKWSAGQDSAIRPLYVKLFERLTNSIDRDGMMDVDDLLWACMLQWAKITTAYCKKAEDHSALIKDINKSMFDIQPVTSASNARNGQALSFFDDINSRRLKAGLKRAALPVYPVDITSIVNQYYDMTWISGIEDRSSSLNGDSKAALLAAAQLSQNVGLKLYDRILSEKTFAQSRKDFVLSDTTKAPSLDTSVAPSSKETSLHLLKNQRVAKAGQPFDASLSLLLQEKLIWDMNTYTSSKVPVPQSSERLDGGESIEMFGSTAEDKSIAEAMNGNGRVAGYQLLQDLPIFSPVSATISMWHLIRLWSVLAGPFLNFLITAREKLDDTLSKLNDPIVKPKGNLDGPLNKFSSFNGRVEQQSAVFSVLEEYSKMLGSAFQVCQALHRECGTPDPSQNSTLPRSSSTVVNPTIEYSVETTMEAWDQLRRLNALISKLSIILSIPFPYDEGNTKTTGRKLQLDRAGVYLFQPEAPQFQNSSAGRN